MSDYSFLDETSNGILVFVKYLGDNGSRVLKKFVDMAFKDCGREKRK